MEHFERLIKGKLDEASEFVEVAYCHADHRHYDDIPSELNEAIRVLNTVIMLAEQAQREN